MKYRVVITNIETGETVRDVETDAVLCGALERDDGVSNSLSAACSVIKLAGVLLSMQRYIDIALEKDPMLKLAMMAVEIEQRRRNEDGDTL